MVMHHTKRISFMNKYVDGIIGKEGGEIEYKIKIRVTKQFESKFQY